MRTRKRAAIGTARRLRRQETLPEKLLWYQFRAHRAGFHVRRQHRMEGYYLDFYVHEARLCIEVDGGVHCYKAWRDMERDKRLSEVGIMTVRVSARSVLKDPSAVFARLYVIMCERSGRDPLSRQQ